MRRNTIIFLSVIIISVILLAMVLPVNLEGFGQIVAPDPTLPSTPTPLPAHSEGNVAPATSTVSNTATTTPAVPNKELNTAPITKNSEFIKEVNSALSGIPNPTSDLAIIYNLQNRISGLDTTNAKTLLSEIGNPNNMQDPRRFLQYMNWYASSYPIDAR